MYVYNMIVDIKHAKEATDKLTAHIMCDNYRFLPSLPLHPAL